MMLRTTRYMRGPWSLLHTSDEGSIEVKELVANDGTAIVREYLAHAKIGPNR